MRTRIWTGALVLLAGCASPEAAPPPPGPAQAGDGLRPRLHVPEPWTAGRKTAFGVYVEVDRPGRAGPYDVKDDDVPGGSIRVLGRVQFFAGAAPLGDPTALPFVHEC